MLTSDLIALLQKQLQTYGDVPVKVIEQTGPDSWRAATVKSAEIVTMNRRPCLMVNT